jgi:hypothetical protein
MHYGMESQSGDFDPDRSECETDYSVQVWSVVKLWLVSLPTIDSSSTTAVQPPASIDFRLMARRYVSY